MCVSSQIIFFHILFPWCIAITFFLITKIYSKIFAIPIVNGFTPCIDYCCFNSQKYSPYTFSFTCQPTKCCHYKKKSSWQVEATTGQFFRKCRLFYLNKFISLFYCIIKGRRLLQRIHTT